MGSQRATGNSTSPSEGLPLLYTITTGGTTDTSDYTQYTIVLSGTRTNERRGFDLDQISAYLERTQ